MQSCAYSTANNQMQVSYKSQKFPIKREYLSSVTVSVDVTAFCTDILSLDKLWKKMIITPETSPNLFITLLTILPHFAYDFNSILINSVTEVPTIIGIKRVSRIKI